MSRCQCPGCLLEQIEKDALKRVLTDLKIAKGARKPLLKSNIDRSYNQILGAVKLLLQGTDKKLGSRSHSKRGTTK